MRSTTSIGLVCVILTALAATAPAQPNPGDIIVVTTIASQHRILCVTPTGTITTLTSPPVGKYRSFHGICPSADNRGLAFLYWSGVGGTPWSDTYHVMEWRGGVISTVGSRTVARSPVLESYGGLVVDQSGAYVAATGHGLLRIYPGGGGSTFLSPAPYPVAGGVADDLWAGGWFVYGQPRMLHVNRQGKISTVATLPVVQRFVYGMIFTDTSTGDLIVPSGDLYRVNPRTSTLTTLARNGQLGLFFCGDVDPWNQTLVAGIGMSIYRLDRRGNVLGTVARIGTTPLSLTVFGSRQISSTGPMKPGTSATIRASFPRNPGQQYHLGLSFGFSTGIPTSAGLIPLNPDALFVASISVPQLVPGIRGKLDGRGEAAAKLVIPPGHALQGVRFFIAGIAHNGQGNILSISEPVGVTVE